MVANHRSAKKRIRQNQTRNEHNKSLLSAGRTAIKNLRLAIEEKDKTKALELLKLCQGKLAKLTKTNILKANTAARKTSRLAKQVASL